MWELKPFRTEEDGTKAVVKTPRPRLDRRLGGAGVGTLPRRLSFGGEVAAFGQLF